MIELEGYSFNPSDVLRSNGRFAIIYKGRRLSDGLQVVVKKLHPRLIVSIAERKRFMNEFRPALKIPGCASVLDLIDRSPDLFLIREYADGIPLDKFIGSFSWRKKKRSGELYSIALKILDGVKMLHAYGIIHADLKPSNFIYNPVLDEITIIDLGLSLERLKIKDIVRNESAPLPFSFLYSAPEIMLNFPSLINESTDIYSTGIILYHLFSGKAPWNDPFPAVLMNLQLVYPLPVNSAIDPAFLNILRKASCKYNFSQPPSRYPEIVQSLNLQEAMEKRYSSVEQMKQEMESVSSLLTRKSWF